MSRIGKMPIDIPAGVAVETDGTQVVVKGKLGELSWSLPAGVSAAVSEGRVVVSRGSETRQCRSYHGLSRSLIANMIEGVSKGFSKRLEIEGVGFRANLQGSLLELALGFASPVRYDLPGTVTCTIEGNGTALVISGADKQQVGLVAARIRSYFPAEPYKGKGVRYAGERIRRKEGKTVS